MSYTLLVFHRMQYIRLLLFYSVIFQSVMFQSDIFHSCKFQSPVAVNSCRPPPQETDVQIYVQ